MYFLLAGALTKFHLLRYGLALILIFVGLKMS
jgi:tellurite resistance protein TerC